MTAYFLYLGELTTSIMTHTFKALRTTGVKQTLALVMLSLVLIYNALQRNDSLGFIVPGILLTGALLFPRLRSINVNTVAQIFSITYGNYLFVTHVREIRLKDATFTSYSGTSLIIKGNGIEVDLDTNKLAFTDIEQINRLIRQMDGDKITQPVICAVCGSTEVYGLLEKPVQFFERGAICNCCDFDADIELLDPEMQDEDSDFLMELRQDWINEGCKHYAQERMLQKGEVLEQLNNLKQLDPQLWPSQVRAINPNWTSAFDVEEIKILYKEM